MKYRINITIVYVLAAFMLMPSRADSQKRIVKILVTTPHIEHSEYRPLALVMGGTIIRELNRSGGMEVIESSEAERYLKEQGLDGWVYSRELALKAGEALGADIVIFSTLRKSYDDFLYTMAFLEVERDVIQRTLHGGFRVSVSAFEIGRLMKEETEKLIKYIPLPSELSDFGSVIRQETVDPEVLPTSAEIDDLPRIGRFGYIEQVFSYFRVFPGEDEYQQFEKQKLITRFQFRQDLDSDLTRIMNDFNIYGDFAIRHDLQAFFIKDCSTRAINVLLANKIPIFFSDGVLIGYEGLSPDGFCLYKTIDNQVLETFDLTHRKRMAVLFLVQKPGRKRGISKDFLEQAVGHYRDEWGKIPELVEVKDSMLDLEKPGLE